MESQINSCYIISQSDIAQWLCLLCFTWNTLFRLLYKIVDKKLTTNSFFTCSPHHTNTLTHTHTSARSRNNTLKHHLDWIINLIELQPSGIPACVHIVISMQCINISLYSLSLYSFCAYIFSNIFACSFPFVPRLCTISYRVHSIPHCNLSWWMTNEWINRASYFNNTLYPIVWHLRRWSQVWHFLELLEWWS